MLGRSTVKTKLLSGIFVSALLVASFVGLGGRARAAACTAPSTDYGTVTGSLSVPSTTTYRIWSRIMVPDSSNKTYLLEIDGSNCYSVGGGTISASTWTWVDYYNGSSSTKVQQTLNQGNRSIKLIGNKPGVKVDRVIAVSDLACVPTGFGDNCNVPSDTTPPVVTLTAPMEGATVSGTTNLTATASDNVGVTKVEFYDNSSLLATDTSSPYTASWDTTKVANGSHLITARAYDAAGSVSSDSSTVNAKNGDSTAPTTPTNLKGTAASYNTINLTWTASTDNVAVTGYTVVRDSVPVGNLGATSSFSDTGLSPNTSYNYQVQAFDAAGNKSALTSKVTVKTPTVPDSEAPSKPIGLTATAASPSQINLSWTPSTDNIGVTAYDVYRSNGTADPQNIGSTASPSFGDSNLAENTEYAYYVIARDASNNASSPSDTVTGKTQQPPASLSSITGAITNQANQLPIAYARVVIVINGNRHTYQADQYGRYAIFNLPPARYNLTFRAKGYYSKTIAVQLGSTPLVQNIALKRR
jgi:chitodextrinase